jgi:hypothetical protein
MTLNTRYYSIAMHRLIKVIAGNIEIAHHILTLRIWRHKTKPRGFTWT